MWIVKVEGVSGFQDLLVRYDNFYDSLTWVRATFEGMIKFTFDDKGDLISDQIAYSGEPFVRIVFN